MVQRLLPLAMTCLLLVACGDDAGGESGAGGSSGPGFGNGTANGGANGAGGGGGEDVLVTVGTSQGGSTASGGDGCNGRLLGKIRDFRADHPDFEEEVIGVDPGIVLPGLGDDGKPVYDEQGDHPTTSGREGFDQWFRDTPGVNEPIELTLQLVAGDGGVFTFDDSEFFPIDGQGFGDEGNDHNFHFTFELRTTFRYVGGEVFRFRGDDDLFTFINGRLAIDLGGVHGAMEAEIDLDARADELDITPGEIYALDFFFAERHTSESNFRIDTTIGEFIDCGSILN
jgi:fibro-slime domain-containing protein